MAASLGWRPLALAGALTMIAGFVDAIGFVHLGGYFVSFMSGNSTRASADLAIGRPTGFWLAIGLVCAFVFGVMAGAVVDHLLERRGATAEARRRGILALSLVLLAASAACAMLVGTGVEYAAPPLAAAAMGGFNGVFTSGGHVSVGVTYMTGTLVKTGQAIVRAFLGGSRTAWLKYATLWVMITAGAFLGATAYRLMGLPALWIAVAAIAAAWAATFARGGRRLRAEP